jgi:hypothetical protein
MLKKSRMHVLDTVNNLKKTNKKFKTDSKDSLKIPTFASICFFLVESRGHVFFCDREIKIK